MPLEHTDSSTGQYDGAKHEKLDSEVREMFNAITSRIFRLHNTGGSSINPHQHHGDAEDDSGGIRVLTLAGNNTGATFRDGQEGKTVGSGPRIDEEEETLGTYVNSNFQAINNSIVMGGSYSANDPGVHADITDFVEHKQKHGKKDKEKEKKKRSAESE
ncbi:hypothetical protein SAY87_031249 [Trapa incisa]|uniref:Uncharacterized protein n=1 Tax=Trapa incisa TaxID=236973 RepID=A0AAN7QKM7_9MYRT|nr:hypothetical protein SAY87_031249 [Trapa incisa]